MQDVVFGHEVEQAFEVCVVDAVDEGEDGGWGGSGRRMALLYHW
ncbi:MAG TPA: hypothetical protein VI876_05260 [Dehalococcoidia bacterium]|nr:hypothetical protein [Dehalococcoidia bacterium]